MWVIKVLREINSHKINIRKGFIVYSYEKRYKTSYNKNEELETIRSLSFNKREIKH